MDRGIRIAVALVSAAIFTALSYVLNVLWLYNEVGFYSETVAWLIVGITPIWAFAGTYIDFDP